MKRSPMGPAASTRPRTLPTRAWLVTLAVSVLAMSYVVYGLVAAVSSVPPGTRNCGSVLGYRTGDYQRAYSTPEALETFFSDCAEPMQWAQWRVALGASVAVTAFGALCVSASRQRLPGVRRSTTREPAAGPPTPTSPGRCPPDATRR